MRWIRTEVLPVPAPATTSMGPARCSMASRWRSSGANGRDFGLGGDIRGQNIILCEGAIVEKKLSSCARLDSRGRLSLHECVCSQDQLRSQKSLRTGESGGNNGGGGDCGSFGAEDCVTERSGNPSGLLKGGKFFFSPAAFRTNRQNELGVFGTVVSHMGNQGIA